MNRKVAPPLGRTETAFAVGNLPTKERVAAVGSIRMSISGSAKLATDASITRNIRLFGD